MASLPNEILPQILLLIQSPLLQGGALTALLELFQALVTTGLPKHGFRDFLQVDPPLMWLCFDCIHKKQRSVVILTKSVQGGNVYIVILWIRWFSNCQCLCICSFWSHQFTIPLPPQAWGLLSINRYSYRSGFLWLFWNNQCLQGEGGDQYSWISWLALIHEVTFPQMCSKVMNHLMF